MYRTISAVTLGCKVNQYDTNAMLYLFRQAGYEIVPWGTPSDIALINTCTVTATADKKSRNLIRQAASRGSRVCVCGCMAQKEGEDLLRFPGVHWLVGTSQRSHVVELVEADDGELLGRRECFEPLRIASPDEKTRGFVKIQEGCDNWCAYCIIPSVRGKPHSRQESEILEEVRRLSDGGVREIVLTGINLSSYRDDSLDLAGLVQRISSVTSLERLRLGSLEPGIFTDEFVHKLADSQILCPSFHISLQSGSARILHSMGRLYTPAEYAQQVDRLRAAFDDPAITTDVITGFPGETKQTHLETRYFLEQVGFSRVHVFPYSERPGTRAASMPDQVPKKLRREYAAELIETGEDLSRAYMQRRLGKRALVLFEEIENGVATGYCERYLRVHVPGGSPGETGSVELLEESHGELVGKLVK